MKVKEYINILENKLDIALSYIENISAINVKYVDELPEGYRNRFILASQNFLSRYKEFLDLEVRDEEETEEN